MMLVLLTACSKQVFAPDFAACTSVTTTDELADGSIERTATIVYDEEGRIVRSTTEVETVFYEEVNLYEGNCLVEKSIVREDDQGDDYVQTTERTCDDNGDPIEQMERTVVTGQQPYEYAYTTTWSRVYGENGQTVAAVRTDSYPQGFELETQETYEYDEQDRWVYYLGVRDDGATQRTRVYADDLEDVLIAEESRDGFGVLTAGDYRVHDERGREIERVTLDETRAETVFVRRWEKKRWADTHLEVTLPEGEGYEATIQCNDEDPWTERTVSYDGWLGERDGAADYVEVQEIECP